MSQRLEQVVDVETPELVVLSYTIAGLGSRLYAALIDLLICVFLFMAVAVATAILLPRDRIEAALRRDSSQALAAAVLIIAQFSIIWGYYLLFEALRDGQTPGKRLMKLRVIREDGRPITLWEAIARNLLRVFDAVPGFLLPIYSVGLIVIFLSNRDQRVGDIFAGTVVIRERTDEAPTFAETFSNPIADAAFRRVQKRTDFTANVTALTGREIEVVESFLRRRWDLTERQRVWMAWRIALPLMYKLKPDYDLTTFSYEGFLEEVLHRFHARQRFLN